MNYDIYDKVNEYISFLDLKEISKESYKKALISYIEYLNAYNITNPNRWNVHTFLNSFRIDIAIPVINGRHIAQTAM
jgi:hypothetical protein